MERGNTTDFQRELSLILNTDDTLPLSPKKKRCGKKFASYGHKGKRHSEEVKKLLSEQKKGVPLSEEHKRKLSEAKKDRHWKLVDGKRVWY